jgi:uncharacterized protein (DUF849 family)
MKDSDRKPRFWGWGWQATTTSTKLTFDSDAAATSSDATSNTHQYSEEEERAQAANELREAVERVRLLGAVLANNQSAAAADTVVQSEERRENEAPIPSLSSLYLRPPAFVLPKHIAPFCSYVESRLQYLAF